MGDIQPEKKWFKIETSALRAYTMLGAMALIWIFFYWQTDGIFLTPRNLSNLMLQTSVTGIVAIGMLMVIVSGNIDLSVGSLLALAGGVSAIMLTNNGYGIVPSIACAIAVSLLIGVFQGLLTAYFSIPAFIVTLGGLLAWRGAIKGISHSETIPISHEWFKFIGQGYAGDAALVLNADYELAFNFGWVIAAAVIILLLVLTVRHSRSQLKYGFGEGNLGKALIKTIIPIAVIIGFVIVMNSYEGIPVPVLIFIAVALIGYFITNNTVFGRYLYAIGGNADAARLSGINNRLNVVKVFALLGALTGIAAIISTARVGSATPDAGTLLELDAIAACVIGGTSLMGGRGTVFGACLGALIMATLDNGMSLLNVQDYMQDLVKGGILVAAVGLDMIGKRT
ncbi:MAG: sugar ABC transporter permease [Acidobacteria bacterium]|nr:sugar ABC transporter permease [Acidobacteriota bacterium]